MAETAISLPFSIDPYGKVAVAGSYSKIWADRVRSVLGTFLRERVHRPTFGTLIPYSLFDTQSAAAAEIEAEVQQAFATQLQPLTLEEVVVTADEYTNTLTAEVIYALPSTGDLESVVLPIAKAGGTAYIDGTFPLFEDPL